MTDTFVWPPAYVLIKHPRARHVKLKTSLRNGLELVVPKRFNQKDIPEILETNKSWIIKHLAKLREQAQIYLNAALPTEIILAACNTSWTVSYIKTESKRLRMMARPNYELVVFGNTEDKALVKKVLVAWIKQQAKLFLPARLQQLSDTYGFNFSSVTIRNQKSRWGSCTGKKSINLNYKLILLSEVLADHIILHELCHTVHMNHSASFWRLVAKFDPDWKFNCKETRKAERFIPTWLGEVGDYE